MFGAEEESPKNYHVSIDIATEKWLDGEGKTFYKTYIDCAVKEIKAWIQVLNATIRVILNNETIQNKEESERRCGNLPPCEEAKKSVILCPRPKVAKYGTCYARTKIHN